MKTLLLLLFIIFSLAANATNYYLSNSGNDNNFGTDPSSPWQTLNKLNSFKNLKPGDNVLFKRGDTFYGTLTIGSAGTSGNQIILGAYGTGARPIITAATSNPCITVTAANRGYWTIDNLDLRSSGIISGTGKVASIYFNYWPSDMGVVPGWIIQNCTFNSSIMVSGPNIKIKNNTFNAGADSIPFGAIQIRGINGVGAIIENDTISHYYDRGVWFYNGADSVIVRNNVIHDIAIGSDQHGAGINNDGATTPNPYGKIYGNTIYNCGYGISHESAFNDTTYNNVIHDCEVGMTSYFYPASYNVASNILIHHNLVYNVQYGFEFWHTRDISCINNTIVQGTGTTSSAFLQNSDTTNVRNISFINNIVSGTWTYPTWNYLSNSIFTSFDYNDIVPAGTTVYRVSGSSKTIAQLQASGLMTHGVIGDPLLSNYYLTAGSPAINTGLDGVDIGAYKYTNVSPIANAGANQIITLPTNSTTLTGSGSDEDGILINYLWTKISGPSNFNIVNAASPVTDVSGLVQGVYLFELKVTDNNGAIGRDTMQLTVNAAGNIAPVANAGSNQTLTLPTNTVSLSGSGTDADGTISSYNWTKFSGPSADTITNANAAATTVTGLVQGVYLFELKVTDNNGAVGRDTMQLTVNAAGNIAPVANAGSNQTITLPTNTVSLSGSGTDADGTISSYNWTKFSGPSAGTITNANAATTTVTSLVQGVYVFQLKVTDNNGATATSTMQVTVNAALVINIAPVANAGSNKSITLPVNTASLAGSGTDADGAITNYLWTKISGPSTFNIVNAASPVTDVSGLVQGVYLFELKVTDNNGATGSDTMQLTVNAVLNQPPTANAGVDQTITLPTNTVRLNGSGKNTDGTVAIFFWTKISGPSTFNIVNASLPVTDVSGLVQGVYQFELKVTDNKGSVGKDTVQITVNAAENLPPTANAGADQTMTLPTNSVSLSGGGSDKDGTIFSYSWTKITGPSTYNIANSSSAVTTVSELAQGIYQFELKVTDNKGAIAKDTMIITVNAAINIPPVANAGLDLTVTLPINAVHLKGSGMDEDGTITSYQWKQISGPAVALISTDKTAATEVKNLVGGTYEFELTVTDNSEGTGRDTVLVVVALGRISVQETNNFRIYPNPVRNIAIIEINTQNLNSNLYFVISDVGGKIIYKKQINSTQYKTIEKIDLNNFPKGTYAVTVFFDRRDKKVLAIIKL